MDFALRDPRLMSDDDLAAEIRALAVLEETARHDWLRHARPEQHEPAPGYRVWLILAGRGWGKTRTGSETVRGWAMSHPRGQYAVIAKTHREVLAICFEAPKAGLIVVSPPAEIAEFRRGSGSVQLRYANGTLLRAFSAEDPDALRGYAFDGVWGDEYAAWPVQTAQAVYDMAWFCMRESPDPRMVITTTPKRLPHVRALLTRADHDHRVAVTRGRTLDNAENLSEAALDELLDRYAGTRLGRQELDAELLTDVEGALWRLEWIEAGRVEAAPELVRTVVAVDPADTDGENSDETAIVVAGRGTDGEDYVLADRSAKVARMAAARRVWTAYADHDADEVVYEGSNNWVRDVLVDAWVAMQRDGTLPAGDPPLRVVQAKRSKRLRAEPVAARYEQSPPRVHHVGAFPRLEAQQTEWTPESGASPDRLDALVYAITRLRGGERATVQVASPLAGASATARLGWSHGLRGYGRSR
jgi:phage terminase large subunit-like protein